MPCRVPYVYNSGSAAYGTHAFQSLERASSGPWGEQSVDWRVGEAWRDRAEVALEAAQTLSCVTADDWFDVHFKHGARK